MSTVLLMSTSDMGQLLWIGAVTYVHGHFGYYPQKTHLCARFYVPQMRRLQGLRRTGVENKILKVVFFASSVQPWW